MSPPVLSTSTSTAFPIPRRFASTTTPPSRPKPAARPAPNQYRFLERRIVYAMVAAPIAIYTSYVLFERLVMGKERKKLGVGRESNVGFIAGTEGSGEAKGVE